MRSIGLHKSVAFMQLKGWYHESHFRPFTGGKAFYYRHKAREMMQDRINEIKQKALNAIEQVSSLRI